MIRKQMVTFGLMTVFGLSACSPWAAIQRPAGESQTDIYGLAYYKQLGSCASLPITHRFLSFEIGMLAPDQNDLFFGVLDIILNESTLTYEAVYREFPGRENSGTTTVFNKTLTGRFTKNEHLILENLGEIEATLLGEKVQFILRLDGPIARDLTRNEALGRVRQAETTLKTVTCP